MNGAILRKLWTKNIENIQNSRFTVVLLLFTIFWYSSFIEENYSGLNQSGLEVIGAIIMKLWTKNKENNHNFGFTVILLLFTIFWISEFFEENCSGLNKSGLEVIGAIIKKLWTKNIENNQKMQITVVLLLFTIFRISLFFEENYSWLNQTGLEVIGAILKKLWTKNKENELRFGFTVILLLFTIFWIS